MRPAPEVIAVIAAYREAGRVGAVVRELKTRVTEVVVVDDGSPDRTGAEAEAAGARVIRHVLNRGQGAALATGLAYALARGADVVVTFDADGQHDPEDIPALTGPILRGEADVALGSRFLDGRSNPPPLRRALLAAARVLTNFSTGVRLTDAHNGLRAFSREAASRIRIRQDRMAHASEITAEIGRLKLSRVEVPVRIRYTPESLRKGQSGLGAVRILFDLLLGEAVR